VHRSDFRIVRCDNTLISVTFCDGQVSGEAKYLVSDSNPSDSQPSSGTFSPSIRPSNLPHQQPSSNQQPQQPPAQVGQFGAHPYTPFVPNMRRAASGPGSPAFSRSVPNGAGAQSRPMAGPGGPTIPASPRLAPPSHPHPPPNTTSVPPQQVQMQHMSWGGPAAYYVRYRILSDSCD